MEVQACQIAVVLSSGLLPISPWGLRVDIYYLVDGRMCCLTARVLHSDDSECKGVSRDPRLSFSPTTGWTLRLRDLTCMQGPQASRIGQLHFSLDKADRNEQL